MYGQNQKAKRPYNWIVINTKDNNGKNRIVLLEVNPNKDNIEIVHWHYIDKRGLDKIKRQAEREDGQLLILPSEHSEEAGALSSRTNGLPSADKDTNKSATEQTEDKENQEFQEQWKKDYNLYEEHKKEQSVSLKGLLDDLENVGISLGTHLSDQTKMNINTGGYFVNAEGSTIVYHGTQKLDLKVEDLEPGHNRVDGEHANFSGYGVSFSPTDDNDYGNGVGEKMLSCRLKIDKPFYVIGNLALDDVRSKKFSEILTAHGYDAIITYPNEYAYIHGYADEIVALKRGVIVPIDKKVKSNTAQEYTYQLTQRPYGIGSQPEGQLRHVDDGSKFGSVVYDHQLSAEEVKNFSLTPITEAKALEGRTFEVPFGEEKDVYHVDKVDDDGTIHYHVNEEAPLLARYHDFLSELGDEAKEVKVNPETGDETLLDVDGKPIVVKTEDNTVELNYRTWQEEKEEVRAALEEAGLDTDFIDALMSQTDAIAESIKQFFDKYPSFGNFQNKKASKRPILRKTDDYITWDYSFNCVKKDAINAVIESVIEAGNATHLGITQIEALKNILQKHGYLTPCVMCYVEAKRKIYKQSKEISVKWDAVADVAGLPTDKVGAKRELTEEQKRILVELSKGIGVERVKNYTTKNGEGIKADTIKKIAKLMLNSPELRGRIDYRDMMSPSSFTKMYNELSHTGLMDFLTQGQSRGKLLLETTPFSLESIPDDLSTEIFNKVNLNRIGGLRQFSYEDARAIMFFDYYQQFMLMEGANAREHLYTKRPFMPEMFGKTGAMMNQSIIVDIFNGAEWHKKALGLSDKEYKQWLEDNAGFTPRGALAKDNPQYEEGSTELVPNYSVESFPIDIAMKNIHNPEYNSCVGNVIVAPSVKFILWALDNPDIHQILAYHANGASPLMKSLTGYDLAKPMDDGYHTLDKDGNAIDSLAVKEIGLYIEGKTLQWNRLLIRNGYDARRAAQVYLDYCKEHGLTPMFCYEGVVDMSGEKATSHPNYYKLLTDFRVYDDNGKSIRQDRVKMILPDNWQSILDKYLNEEQSTGERVKQIKFNDELQKEIRDATRYASMEQTERDTFVGVLKKVYGDNNISVCATREFDKMLDEAQGAGTAEMLRNKGGVVYGFAVGDKIVLNEDYFNAHTPMHEHTHIYMKVLKATNPRLYQRGMELWRGTELWESARKGLEMLGEEATDEKIFSECMSQFTGAENERIISEVTGVTDKVWLKKAITWIKEMWNGVKSAFSRWTDKQLDDLTAEQFGSMPIRALYDEAERKVYKGKLEQYKKAKDILNGKDVEMHSSLDDEKRIDYAAREVATNLARKALGDDSVINDWDFGQRVLDEVNGKARKMAFGEPYDYEKYPRGRVEPNLAEKSVSVVAADANHGFTNYKEAKSWAKQNISKVYNNEETGGKGTVRISNAAIDKFLSQSAIDKSDNKDVHMSVLKVLPEVLKTSLDVETHPDFLKGENGKRNVENGINKDVLVHRCYGAVSIDGKPYRVKITLKENVKTGESTNTHSYEATKIELLAGQHGDVTRTSPRYSNNSITAAKLLNGVEMSYDSGKKLLDESKKRSERIREQRVYHGSGADFDHFDHSHMGEGEGAQAYGWGTYVTEVEGIGRTYANSSASNNADFRKLMDDIIDYGTSYDSLENVIKKERLKLKREERSLDKAKKYAEQEALSPAEKIDAQNKVERCENRVREVQESINSHQQQLNAIAKGLAEAKRKYSESKYKRHLYTVEIPDDNRHNYLDWANYVPKETLEAVKKELKEYIRFGIDDIREALGGKEKTKNYSDDALINAEFENALHISKYGEIDSGQDLYNRLKAYFGSQEEASRFLSNLGLVGIKYPADYRRGGRFDEAKNYVIFNENDAKITDHIRYFRTPNGEAYGFTLGGKIYIDPRVATAETPIHEYSHLWATAMKKNNPAEWENIVGLMKGTSVWEEVKKTYPELTDDSEIADEVLAHYSGRRGAERLREEMRKAAEGNGSPLDKAKAVSALQKVKVALDKFWKGVADFLHIHYTTAEEVADRVMKDLLDGVDPRKFVTEEDVVTDSNLRFHKETDAETLKRLNNEPTIKVYRAMQVIDGKLYPPMAAKIGKDLVESNELGVWIRADENPELAIADIDKKTGKQKIDKNGELKWKFKLDKGGKDALGKKATDVVAAYNPYWHTSRSPLNDQFKSAWIRPNIVIVECEVPEKELTSGYKAERAKDSVGEVDWKSGSVSGEVFKQTGNARKVILSRWCKPVRILSDAEVAQKSKEFIGDADVVIPENVLTPKQKVEFEKVGLKIGEPEKGVNKTEQIEEALRKGLMVDNSLKSDSDKGMLFSDDETKSRVVNPTKMSETEKAERGERLLNAPTIEVSSNQIVKSPIMSARKASENWWRENIGKPLLFTTEIGTVEIDSKSIGDSLAHGYNQSKLDAITSLKDGFKNAVYLGSMPDFTRQEGVTNHYFAYPIMYDGKRNYVFCRAMQDNNKNRLYVHEVFLADNLQKEGNTLQTAAFQPHGGIALYKAILTNVLSDAKVGKNTDTAQQSSDNNLYRLKDGTFIKSGSYFSGGGLLEEGLKRYLDPSVAVEFNEKISGVYADNFGNHIVTADVRDVDPRELAKKIDGEVQYFHASPVCKNYSRAKREGGEVELDKETAQSTADFISAKRPKVVTIENVKGYKNSEALKIITDELTKQGYDWDMDVYNTADYGGYTKRERLIVRAVRDGKLPEKPQPLPESERKQGWWEAVEDLIADLPEKKSGVADWMDTRLKGEGIDYRKIDKPLYVFGQGNNAHSVSHAFADELIPTLRTKGGDVIIMPDGRVLQATPRVLARLTGLGDDYKMPETDQLAHTIVGNGIPTQLSENVIGPLLDHAFNEGERASSESMITDRRNNDKRDTATRLTSAMHLDGSVEVVDTNEGLEGKKRNAKGWYDPRTGKITVVLGNHESAADVQKTIFHEAVAHKGLRTIVGEENFDTFVDNVYRNAEEGIQAEVDRLAEEKYKGDKRVAMEEYMAKLAEDGEFMKPENKKLFEKVKDFIVDLLKKAGIDLGFKLTDNDIRYMLWRSYKNLTENVHRNAFEMAEDAKMREKFEQTPEAERRGEQRRRQETLFRDGNETIQKAVETMRERVSKAVDISKENKADTMRDIGGNLTKLRRAVIRGMKR